MSELVTLFDPRKELYRECFAAGLAYEEYVKTGTEPQQSKWRYFESQISLSQGQKEKVRTFSRTMHVLVVSGVWCGDCARQGPILRAIELAAPATDFRYVENSSAPQLRDEVRMLGGTRVPIVILLSEDFFEVARFGDRTLSAYRRKFATELGPACDAGIGITPFEIAPEIQDWIDCFERAHLALRLSPTLRKRHGD